MFNPMQGGAPQQNQFNPLQAIQDFARQIGSPQRLVQQFFGFVPQNIQNDPNQNTSDQPILVRNANIIFERPDLTVTR